MNFVPIIRKTIFIAVFIAITGLPVFALGESGDMGFGGGMEMNMNSSENFAGAAVLGFNYNLPLPSFTAGITAGISLDFSTGRAIEFAPFFRWYVLGGYSGIFAQADVGFSFITESEENFPRFLGGLRGGYRMPLGDKFFVEPYVRAGYPFAFGIGVIGGLLIQGAGTNGGASPDYVY